MRAVDGNSGQAELAGVLAVGAVYLAAVGLLVNVIWVLADVTERLGAGGQQVGLFGVRS